MVPTAALAETLDETGLAKGASSQLELSAGAKEESFVVGGKNDGDTLLDGYILQQFGQEVPPSNGLRLTTMSSDDLEGNDLIAFNLLKDMVAEVAAGERESTIFEFDPSLFCDGKTSFTAADLGVDAVVVEVDGRPTISSEAANAAWALLDFDFSTVLQTLIHESPYELYWFDSTKNSFSGKPKIGARYEDGEWHLYFSEGTVNVKMSVSEEYADTSTYEVDAYTGKYLYYRMDTSTGATVQAAVANAQSICAASDGKTLYDRLAYFKDQICELTSYNSEAADDETETPYGNPWQLVWVFDGDPDTTVVCEGYSKAFKYLCDETLSGGPSCYLATGILTTTGTGGENHMWDIVHMDDGKNYLVDVTNCDEHTIGYPDKLFVVPYSTGSVHEGYWFDTSSRSTVGYIYADEELNYYTTEELTISGTAYERQTQSSVEDAEITVDADGLTYTGDELKPAVTVTLDGRTLSAETDYDVAYANNINAGTGTVTITGKSNCTGTKSAEFTIAKAAQTVTADDVTVAIDQNADIEAVASAGGELSYQSSNTRVATVSSTGVVMPTNVGTTYVTITAAATDNYEAANTTITVTVVKGTQTIRTHDLTVSLGNTGHIWADASGGGAISYSGYDTAVVRVNSYGVVTPVAVGSTTVTVTAAATSNYEAASTTITVTVTKRPQSINANSVYTVKMGKTVNLNATASGGGALSYKSQDAAVATVDGDGVVTPVSVGTTTVTITADETDTYQGAAKEVMVSVERGTQTISADDVTVAMGQTASLNVSASGGGSLSYVSNDTAVVTVDESGVVTPVSVGEATITITAAATASYEAATKDVTVTVTEIPPQEQTIDASDKTVAMGETVALDATASAGGALSYVSKNTAVATVDESGVVTPVSVGEATITITAAATEGYSSATKDVTVTVTKGAQAIDANDKTVAMGETVEIGASASAGGALSYESQNPDVATVDEAGTVTPVSVGTATITITADATDSYESATKDVTVTVNKGAQTITATDKYVAMGETVTLDATASAGGALSYVSKNTAVATVDESGIVTPVSVGTATITITAASTDSYESATMDVTVTVTEAPIQEQTIEASDKTVAFGETVELGATASAGGALSYESKDTGVVTVDETGTVTPVSVGTATITITAAATDGYFSATKDVTVTVVKGTQTVTANNVTIRMGDTGHLRPNASGGGAISYSDYDTSIVMVGTTGLVRPVSAGVTSVTITAAATSNYEAASTTVTITVNKGTQTIFVSGTNSLAMGTTFSLNAVSTAGGKLSYESQNPAVATVNENGVVTPVSVGDAYVIVRAAATDNYEAAFRRVTIRVVKGAQTVTASDVTVAMGQTATVDATASAGGKLSFLSASPLVALVGADGTVVPVSVGTASVTITAAETDSYEAATTTITVTVTKGTQTIDASDKTVAMGETVEIGASASAGGALSYESKDTDVATVDGNGIVTPVSVGTATITITADATDSYESATKEVTVTVVKGAQTIDASDVTVAMGQYVELVATASAGGKLSYESQNPDVATVSEDGIVTPVSVGTATISITAAATDGYESATRDVTVTVTKGAQTIDASDVTVAIDQTTTVDAAASAGGSLSYASSDPAVATVDEDGVVTPVSVGTATITITAGATDSYESATKDVTVTVVKGAQTVTASDVTVAMGQTATVDATASAGGKLSFLSASPLVALVGADGTVVPVSVGTASVTITAAETDSYEAGTTTITVTVTKGTQTIDASDKTVAMGQTVALDAVASDNGELSYESSDPAVATVSEDGIVTPVSVGTATITITAATTDSYESATKEVTVTVVKGAQTIDASDKTVAMGQTVALDAVASDNGELSYESSDPAVATVSEGGAVTPVSVGTATITITAAATDGFEAATKDVTVTVTEPAPREQTIDASDKTVAMGETVALDAAASAGGALSYESNDSTVATVDGSGVVTPVSVGTATITITAAATDDYSSATKDVTITVVKGAQTVTAPDVTVAMGQTVAIEAVASAGGALSYESKNTAVATVDRRGVVTPVSVGTATIAIAAGATDSYESATATVTVTVTKGTQTVTASDVTVAMGQTATVEATASAGGTLSYESKDAAVATVDESGIVTPVSVGTATITITAGATDSYESATRDVTVTVTKGTQAIDVSDKIVAMKETVSLDAIAPAGGSLTYTSSDPTVATVSEEGVVTPVSVGTATITITAAATDGYESATRTVTVTVTEGAPSNWVRLSGEGRFNTMAAIVEEGFDKSDWAVIAYGWNYPDALAAAALAGYRDCPVVLTQRDYLSPEAAAKLKDLGVSHAYVMGGTAAVGKAAEAELAGMGIEVTRVAGDDRMSTSLEALRVLAGTQPTTVVVATGYGFADTLSIGPWCYREAAPILLTKADGRLTDAQVAAVRACPSVTDVVIVGGEAVVSPDVERQLSGYSITRLAGEGRYETSRLIAEWEMARGMGVSNAAVAYGRNFPDALAGAALCGRNDSVLLLAEDANRTALDATLTRDGVATGYVFGGTSAVSDATLDHCKKLTR